MAVFIPFLKACCRFHPRGFLRLEAFARCILLPISSIARGAALIAVLAAVSAVAVVGIPSPSSAEDEGTYPDAPTAIDPVPVRGDVPAELLPAPPKPVALETSDDPTKDALEILGAFVEPGTVARLVLGSSESFAGATLETPVVVVHGSELGPSLCIIAGIHGDEVNGVEVVRRVLLSLEVDTLKGSIIAVPIANPSAFLRGSRYLLDRRDLNRYFPGSETGSSASRIAHVLFEGVIRNCDALIDLHTGSFKRTNFHQLRANLAHEETAKLAATFGGGVVINSEGRMGTLRRAATDLDIPAITVEAGAPGLFEEMHVEEALDGIGHLLSARGMLLGPQLRAPLPETTAYLRTRWIRSDQGGILVSKVNLGDEVEEGEVLGTISDPLSDEVDLVVSPLAGRVIGMALDQLVMPGFAAYHVGFETRPLGARIPAVAGDAEDALEDDPAGVDLEDRPE